MARKVADHFSGLRGERRREFERPGRVCGGVPGGDLRDGSGMHARVLADVQRLQVQAVGTNLQQQRVDQHAGKAASTVAHEAGADNAKIAEEFGGAGVGPERGDSAGNWTDMWGGPPRRIMMQPTSRRVDSKGIRFSKAVWPAGRSCAR